MQGVDLSTATNLPLPPSTVPSLRHLVLETGMPEGPPIDSTVMSWIHAPGLLALHALGWERPPHSWNFILRTLSEDYSRLTCLSLTIEQHPSPVDVPYADVFRNLQALENLTFHCSYVMSRVEGGLRDVYCIAPLMDAEVCPRLVKLVALNTGTSIGDWIDLASGRDAARRRLQCLVANTIVASEDVEKLRLFVDKVVFVAAD